jgi:hypothetical protein
VLASNISHARPLIANFAFTNSLGLPVERRKRKAMNFEDISDVDSVIMYTFFFLDLRTLILNHFRSVMGVTGVGKSTVSPFS